MFRERLVAAPMLRIQEQHTNGQDRKPSWSQFYRGGCGLQDRESVERGDAAVVVHVCRGVPAAACRELKCASIGKLKRNRGARGVRYPSELRSPFGGVLLPPTCGQPHLYR